MSTPTLSEFDPRPIKWQHSATYDYYNTWDFNDEFVAVMFSGAVGSAKSLGMAHLIVLHCVRNPGAQVLLGRRTMPNLKDTIFQMILDHVADEIKIRVNSTRAIIYFPNGSVIRGFSWADKQFKKVRSYPISCLAIEELTENDDDEFLKESLLRLGRVKGIKENLFITATNPSDPSHFAYDYFIKGSKTNKNRHVYYSVTTDNPFLPKWYLEHLRTTLTEKEYKRMALGQWLYLSTDTIYYSYNSKIHYHQDKEFPLDINYEMRLAFDFNIGTGKPQSSILMQWNTRTKTFYIIDEVIIEGLRTLDVMNEWANRGYFDHKYNLPIIVHGDASGSNRDTRGTRSDFDQIEKYLANYERPDREPLEFEIDVPKSNPRIRDRHNLINGLLKNAEGRVSILLSKKCKTLDEGLTKTKLKENGQFVEIEDYYQHVTTALGYACHAIINYGGKVQPIIFR